MIPSFFLNAGGEKIEVETSRGSFIPLALRKLVSLREQVVVEKAGELANSLKAELEKASSKYHIAAAWAAIIFDPLFAFTDFLNIPASWLQVLGIRLAVAFITLCTLAMRNKYQLSTQTIVLVPFVLISLQNAYTYSLIGSQALLGHNLNYMALLVGAAMFVLWPWTYSLFLLCISALATAFFLAQNPSLEFNQFFLEGGLLLAAVGVFMVVLIKARYGLTVKEIKARLELKETNRELEEQKALIESKNEKITDSITYAKRIQDAILGNQFHINSWFDDSFVLFKPKDILSGDFYWFYENKEKDLKIVVAGDCTGHGVPAALMTVLGNSILNEVVIQQKIEEPDKILLEMDKRMIEQFQNTMEGERKVNDGMDVSILVFRSGEVSFAAAKNPLCIVREGQLELLKGSKFPIGSSQYKQEKVYEKHVLDCRKGDKLFLYSDGFQDQFGGENNMKYLSKRFRELLLQTSSHSMAKQKELLEEEFNQWQGDKRQTDDVLIVGISL